MADGTHRSRLVAKEIKTDNAPELFAATPRFELLAFFGEPPEAPL